MPPSPVKQKQRLSIAVAFLFVAAALIVATRSRSPVEPVSTQESAHPPSTAAAKQPLVSATAENPVKKALHHSAWEIVPSDRAPGSDSTPSSPEGTRAQFSLVFVRADFDRAGMRDVHRFAAFSPPQFEAILASVDRRENSERVTAENEIVDSGERMDFDLVNAGDHREFGLEFTPHIATEKGMIRLQTLVRGTSLRREGNLPIWDGQTVMILLGESGPEGDTRQLAAFLTVRLVGPDDEPLNEFIVHQ